MKRLTLAFLVVATGFSGGCAMTQKPAQQPVSSISAVKSGGTSATDVAKPERRLERIQLQQELSQDARSTSVEQPFAVIKVNPETGSLTREMELRLQKVVQEAKQDETLLIRLEAYVPAGGSPGLDLGRSEKVLKIVRDRLVDSGISRRRVMVSSFGAEHDIQRDPTRHWVEVDLIRTGPTSTPGVTGTSR